MSLRTSLPSFLLLSLALGAASQAHATTAGAILGYPYNVSQAASFDQYTGGRIRNISTGSLNWRMTTPVDSRYYQTYVTVRAGVATAPVSCVACTVTSLGTESCGSSVSTTSTTAVTLYLGLFLVPSSGGYLLFKCDVGAGGEVVNYRWE